MLKKIIIFITAAVMSLTSYCMNANEILKRVDSMRTLGDECEIMITLDYYKSNKKIETNILKGYISGTEKSMIEFLEPANMKDRRLLAIEDDMWMFFPNTKRPVRITAAQKLMGGFSNGDIAKTSVANDYIPEAIREEAESNCWVLELKAKSTSKTYNKIVMWVSKDKISPVKADFYALSGKKLKSAQYSDVENIEGKEIITKIIVYDEIKKEEYSVMKYNSIKSVKLNPKYFNKEYLQRM